MGHHLKPSAVAVAAILALAAGRSDAAPWISHGPFIRRCFCGPHLFFPRPFFRRPMRGWLPAPPTHVYRVWVYAPRRLVFQGPPPAWVTLDGPRRLSHPYRVNSFSSTNAQPVTPRWSRTTGRGERQTDEHGDLPEQFLRSEDSRPSRGNEGYEPEGRAGEIGSSEGIGEGSGEGSGEGASSGEGAGAGEGVGGGEGVGAGAGEGVGW